MAGRLPMLRSRRDFDRIQVEGRSASHPLVHVRSRANEMSHDRFGISTGRKVGGAVVRNRVRRRVREALRQLPTAVGDGRDILIVAKPLSAQATYQEIRAAIERLVGPIRTREAASGR